MHTTITGRITSIRPGTTSGGKGVTNFGLAIQGPARPILQDGKPVTDSQGRELYTSQTSFVNCALFHNVDADRLVAERLRIGMKVEVTGQARARAYTDNDGKPAGSLDLTVEYVGPADHRSLLAFCGRDEAAPAPRTASKKGAKPAAKPAEDEEDIS
jgi:single-stranded DNA-binding protein